MKSCWSWKEEENGVFTLYLGLKPLLSASASASATDRPEVIDTRNAALRSVRAENGGLELVYESASGLRLTESLTVSENGAGACCRLSRADGTPVRSDSLTPLIAHARGDDTPYLWRDLGAKMLLVPYDNDMWMRYEAVALRAGRKSRPVQ